MTNSHKDKHVLLTPRRPSVVAGLIAGAAMVLFLLVAPFVIPAQKDPTRFWLYVYIWIFPILIPSIFSLFYMDFCQINWTNNRLICHRTISNISRFLGGRIKFGERMSLRFEITEVSLVWEGKRLLLYCDGLGAGIYLGRGDRARARLTWLLEKGLTPPFKI